VEHERLVLRLKVPPSLQLVMRAGEGKTQYVHISTLMVLRRGALQLTTQGFVHSGLRQRRRWRTADPQDEANESERARARILAARRAA
jgi:hypothetical protein